MLAAVAGMIFSKMLVIVVKDLMNIKYTFSGTKIGNIWEKSRFFFGEVLAEWGKGCIFAAAIEKPL
jgi:hypothetical protein